MQLFQNKLDSLTLIYSQYHMELNQRSLKAFLKFENQKRFTFDLPKVSTKIDVGDETPIA